MMDSAWTTPQWATGPEAKQMKSGTMTHRLGLEHQPRARTGRELQVGAAIARGYREMGVRLNGAATDRFQEANSRKLLRKLFRALGIRST